MGFSGREIITAGEVWLNCSRHLWLKVGFGMRGHSLLHKSVSSCFCAYQVLFCALDHLLIEQYAAGCFETGFNCNRITSCDKVLAFVVVHLMQEAKILLADGEKATSHFDQLTTTQFLNKLVVLPNDSDAQMFLLHQCRCDPNSVEKEPCGLVETRHIHSRVHVTGEIVFRCQHSAFEGMNPFRHINVSDLCRTILFDNVQGCAFQLCEGFTAWPAIAANVLPDPCTASRW